MASITKFHHAIKTSKKSRIICSAVIRKLRKTKSSNILRRHYRQRLVSLLALKDFREQNLPQILTPPQSSDEESSTMTQCLSPIYHVTTKRSLLNRLKPSEPRSRFGSRRTARKRLHIERSEAMSGQQPAKPQRQSTVEQEPPIPDFATTYVTGTQMPIFDKNSYAAITCVQQRRQYKAEYEQDYDEYYQLIHRIQQMQRDYQLLTYNMQRVLEGSIDYESAKERLDEYYRNNSEQMFQHTHRFHYLHSKLAYILKLVADYDESFTSNSAAARLTAAARDYHQRQQLDYMSASETGFGTMSREYENLCYNLQPPTMRLTVANLKQHDTQQENIKLINGMDAELSRKYKTYADWNHTTETLLDDTDSDDDKSIDTDSSYSESTDIESHYSEADGKE